MQKWRGEEEEVAKKVKGFYYEFFSTSRWLAQIFASSVDSRFNSRVRSRVAALSLTLGGTGALIGSYGTSFWELRDLPFYSENLYTYYYIPGRPSPDFGRKNVISAEKMSIRSIDILSPEMTFFLPKSELGLPGI